MNKMLKRLCCLCLAMLLMFSFAACGSKNNKPAKAKKSTTDNADKTKKEKPKPYAKGTVEGNHFESEWLNMKADFSDQYVMATEEEIAQMQSEGSEIMMNEEGQEIMDEAQEDGTVTNEMMVVAVSGTPNCTIVVEKLPLKNMTEKQYLQSTKEGLLSSMTEEVKIAVRGEMPTVVIAEEDYLCLQADISMGDIVMRSNTYVRIKDGYAVVINATFDADTETQKDEMLAAFQPIKHIEK